VGRKVTIHVDPARPVQFGLHGRIPAWTLNPTSSWLYHFADTESGATTVSLNGKDTLGAGRGVGTGSSEFALDNRPGGAWRRGDVVTIDMPMPVRRVLANDKVADDRGLAAIQRGPILYALEAIDTGGSVKELKLPLDTPFSSRFRADRLGGVQVVTATVGGRTIPPSRTTPGTTGAKAGWKSGSRIDAQHG
jgi:DUF1680 family protein